MDFQRLPGLSKAPEPSVSREFDVKIERMPQTSVLKFTARVRGHFVPRVAAADFVVDVIGGGIPNMNIRLSR
jgi:hypothetical protein